MLYTESSKNEPPRSAGGKLFYHLIVSLYIYIDSLIVEEVSKLVLASYYSPVRLHIGKRIGAVHVMCISSAVLPTRNVILVKSPVTIHVFGRVTPIQFQLWIQWQFPDDVMPPLQHLLKACAVVH